MQVIRTSMDFGLLHILKMLGAIVIFLYGMRLLSEAMQKVAGERLRRVLRKMTKNYFTGILSGLLITAVIQSSSASTVMFISFVNAGLLSLTESISLILGANIGTTITTWIITLLGFKIEIGSLCLPLIAVSFPLLFSRRKNLRSWGEVLFGFSLLFLGLDFLKIAIPDIHNNPEVLAFLKQYTGSGLANLWLFIIAGLVVTLIVQSSSAVLALILVMCGNGWIGFEMGAAMIIGSNIGTTVTANVAALVANIQARKAALAHFVFNLMGAVIVSVFFSSLVDASDWIATHLQGSSPATDILVVPIGLSVFHTLFNGINVLIMVWFIKAYVRIIDNIFPERKGRKSGLKFITTGLLSTSEMSMLQVRKEVNNYTDQAYDMYRLVGHMFKETNPTKIQNLFEELEIMENQMDENEAEIANYLSQLSETDLSISASRKIRSMLKISDNIESIADNCYNLGRILKRKSENRVWFTPELRDQISDIFNRVDAAFDHMQKNLHAGLEGKRVDMNLAYDLENNINDCRNSLKDSTIDDVKKKEYRYQAGVLFLDMVSVSENIGDHIINVSQALTD